MNLAKIFNRLSLTLDVHLLGLLLVVIFALFFLNGGASFVAHILFWFTPLLFSPFLVGQKQAVSKTFLVVTGLWLLYLVINLLSTFKSISLSLSVPAILELVGVFSYWLIISFLLQRKEHLRLLHHLILIVGFLLSFLSLYFLFPNTPKPIAGMNLFYANYGHNHLASYLLVVLPIVIARWLTDNKNSTKWLGISLFFFLVFSLTFSRGAFLVLPLATTAILVRYKPKLNSLLILGLMTILPLIFLLGFLSISHSAWASQLRNATKNVPWLYRQLVKPVNQESRLGYWQQAFAGWQAQPFLGFGPRTFQLTSLRFKTPVQSYSLYTHSSILEHMSETGTLGLVAFLLLTLTPLIYLWRRPKDELTFPLLLGATLLWVYSLIDFDFDFLAIVLLFWTILASLIALEKGPKDHFPLPILRALVFILSVLLFAFLALSVVSKGFLIVGASIKDDSQKEKRLQNYQKALKLFPFDKETWLVVLKDLNQSNLSSGEFHQRSPFFNRENPSVISLLAENSKREGQMVEAERLYSQLIRLEPTNINYLLELMALKAKNNDLMGAWDGLQKATQLELSRQKQTYPDLTFPQPPEIPLPESSTKVKREYSTTLSRTRAKHEDETYLTLAKIYYHLGLIAYEKRLDDKAAFFWQTAINLAPEWSYFHEEVINLYFSLGKPDLAQRAISFCQNFLHAKQSCQQATGRTALSPVGYLENTISNL